jgi:hypothetical protein
MRAPILLPIFSSVAAILSAVYSEGGLRVAQTVTLVPGDGIGPDLTDYVKEAIGAPDVAIEWELAEAGEARPYWSRCSRPSKPVSG